jgi:phosphonate transport system substrate-binding protein
MNPPAAARRRALLAAAFACALPPGVRAQGATESPLRIALMPYLPARALLEAWEPLRAHLAAMLGERVEMYSATDFRALVESARARAQDLTLVAPHLGQMLAREGAAVWVAMPARRAEVQIATALPDGAPWDGRRIAVGDPLSISTLLLRRWLAARALTGRVTVVEAPNLATAALWLARGETDAIVLAATQLPELAPLRELRGLRTVTLDWIHTPGWQVRADMPAARRQALQAALLAYRAPEDRGTAATARWELPDAALLARYDDLAADAKALLAGRR